MELSREQIFILLVCVAASLKILFFSLSLPFFPLDEELHFDAIQKFASGYKAQAPLPSLDKLSVEIIELYHSPEFLRVAEPGRPFVPLSSWCRPSQEHLPPELADRVTIWAPVKNVEIDAPPAYYTIEAVWYKIGRWMGYSGLFLLYWLRSLSALAYGVFVLLAWLFVRECYRDNRFLQICVPIFLLVFPQDCFLFLIPNSLSAVWMTAALLLFAKVVNKPERSVALYAAAGLAAATTALLSFGNFTVGLVVCVAAYFLVKPAWALPQRDSRIAKTLVMMVAAAVPVGAWLVHNRLILGNWSGSKSKQEFLTWTVKPISEWIHHPLFTFAGFHYFLATLARNFWRGEMYWGAEPRTAAIDPFYLWLSLFLCGVFVVHILRRRTAGSEVSFADAAAILLILGSVLFLMALSMPFDFGRCFYPSRARPYFVSGRLIIGALVPFLILFLGGLQVVCGWISKRLNPLYVAIPLAACVFVVETVLFIPILSSRFNLISFLLGRSCS